MKNPTWQVVVPWIGPPGLLELCLCTMKIWSSPGVPVLVVDNTPDRASDGVYHAQKPGVEVVHHPLNLGIAASWNLGLERGADFTVLLSASVWFEFGLSDAISAGITDKDLKDGWGMRTPLAWHAHIVGRRCVEEVGMFDERFWPAEYEDTDYMRRMALAGYPYDSLPIAGTYGMYSLGTSIAGHMGLAPKSEQPRLHYIAKWGGEPGSETSEVSLI